MRDSLAHESAADDSLPLRGQKFCTTGRLANLTRAELAEVVRSEGGTWLDHPRRTSFTLIVGDIAWPATASGAPTLAFRRARRYRALGYRIEFVQEQAFLDRLGQGQDDGVACRAVTIGELARLLDLPAAKIRRWMRAGLIEPAVSSHRLVAFDFHQVASAKRVAELLAAGVSLSQIRHGIAQLQSHLPDERLPLALLSRLEHDGGLLLRLHDTLVDARGQRRFDFDALESDDATVSFAPPASRGAEEAVDALFDAALAAEDAGDAAGAAKLYRQALDRAPHDPVLHFNLGNVLFELGRFREARQAFEQATSLDPHYAEAWNNLGNVHAQLGNGEQAVHALRQAFDLVPWYADARHNLADVLQQLGRYAEADAFAPCKLSFPAREQRRRPQLKVVGIEPECQARGS